LALGPSGLGPADLGPAGLGPADRVVPLIRYARPDKGRAVSATSSSWSANWVR
jgi:hypothetical protein